jgi:hypothetical protein
MTQKTPAVPSEIESRLETVRSKFNAASSGWNWNWSIDEDGNMSVFRYDEGCESYLTGIVTPEQAAEEFESYAKSIGICID